MNSNSQFKFQDLHHSWKSIDNEYQDCLIDKIYSEFTFYDYRNSQNNNLIDSFLKNSLNESKLITYNFYQDLDSSNILSLKDQLFTKKLDDPNKKTKLKDCIHCIICIEKKCFILESLSKDIINEILFNSKAALINVSNRNKNHDIQEENDAVNKVRNFLDITRISGNQFYRNNFFLKGTIFPILTFLIHRFFYPSSYFNDSTFFKFDNKNDESLEADFKQNINIFLNSNDDHSKFISNFQQLKEGIQNKVNDLKNAEKTKINKIIEFEKKNFIELRTVYTNSSASFHLVIHTDSLYVFIMKKLNKNVFIHEIEFCKFLAEHPNKYFTKFYGFIKKGEEIKAIIYEYVCNGTLTDFISKKQDELFLFTTAIRILQGIQYLQKYSLVHRDLKPFNILIDHNLNALISDNETIRLYYEEERNENYANNPFTIDVVTLNYGSPEQIDRDAFQVKTDIYYYGEIIYFLFEKKDTFCLKDCIKCKVNDIIPDMTNDLKYINIIYHSSVRAKYEERCSLDFIENNMYNQVKKFCFLKHCILNNENKYDVIQFFTEILLLIIQFNLVDQLTDFLNNQLFSFLFINSLFEDNKSDLLFILGTFYFKGKYVSKNDLNALNCFLCSAEYENTNALLALGDLYYHGNIVIRDQDKADSYYSKYHTKLSAHNPHLYFDYFFEEVNNIQIEYYNLKQFFILNDDYHNCYTFALIAYLYSHVYGIKNNYFEDEKTINKYLENSPTFLYIGHLLYYGQENESDFYGIQFIGKFNFDNFDEIIKNSKQNSDIINSIGYFYLYGIIFEKS